MGDFVSYKQTFISTHYFSFQNFIHSREAKEQDLQK